MIQTDNFGLRQCSELSRLSRDSGTSSFAVLLLSFEDLPIDCFERLHEPGVNSPANSRQRRASSPSPAANAISERSEKALGWYGRQAIASRQACRAAARSLLSNSACADSSDPR